MDTNIPYFWLRGFCFIWVLIQVQSKYNGLHFEVTATGHSGLLISWDVDDEYRHTWFVFICQDISKKSNKSTTVSDNNANITAGKTLYDVGQYQISTLNESTLYQINITHFSDESDTTSIIGKYYIEGKTGPRTKSSPQKPDFKWYIADSQIPLIVIIWLPCGKNKKCNEFIPSTHFSVRYKILESKTSLESDDTSGGFYLLNVIPGRIYEVVVTSINGDLKTDSDMEKVFIDTGLHFEVTATGHSGLLISWDVDDEYRHTWFVFICQDISKKSNKSTTVSDNNANITAGKTLYDVGQYQISTLNESTLYQINITHFSDESDTTSIIGKYYIEGKTGPRTKSSPQKPDFKWYIADSQIPLIVIIWLPCGKNKKCNEFIPSTHFSVRYKILESKTSLESDDTSGGFYFLNVIPGEIYEVVVTSINGDLKTDSDMEKVFIDTGLHFEVTATGHSGLLISWDVDDEYQHTQFVFICQDISKKSNKSTTVSDNNANITSDKTSYDAGQYQISTLNESTLYQINITHFSDRSDTASIIGKYYIEGKTGPRTKSSPQKPDFKWYIADSQIPFIVIIWLPCGKNKKCNEFIPSTHFSVRYKILESKTSLESDDTSGGFYLLNVIPGRIYEVVVTSINGDLKTDSDMEKVFIETGLHFEVTATGHSGLLISWDVEHGEYWKTWFVFICQDISEKSNKSTTVSDNNANITSDKISYNIGQYQTSTLNESTLYQINITHFSDRSDTAYIVGKYYIEGKTGPRTKSSPQKPDFKWYIGTGPTPLILIFWLPCGKYKKCNEFNPSTHFSVRYKILESKQWLESYDTSGGFFGFYVFPGRIYEVVVTSINGDLKTNSDIEEVLIKPVCSPVREVKVVQLNSTSLLISWKPPLYQLDPIKYYSGLYIESNSTNNTMVTVLSTDIMTVDSYLNFIFYSTTQNENDYEQTKISGIKSATEYDIIIFPRTKDNHFCLEYLFHYIPNLQSSKSNFPLAIPDFRYILTNDTDDTYCEIMIQWFPCGQKFECKNTRPGSSFKVEIKNTNNGIIEYSNEIKDSTYDSINGVNKLEIYEIAIQNVNGPEISERVTKRIGPRCLENE